jgi:Restriction endonuclease
MSVHYERFVQETYQDLVNQDSVKNVTVQHNVKIKGRSGAEHQIDVYWKFEIAGEVYQTCIECKHHSTKVKKLHVAAFAKTLEDIQNTTGIFVTTVGYQRGAQLLGAHHKIKLLLVLPTIQEVHIDGKFTQPHYNVQGFEFDRDGCRPLLQAAGLDTYDVKLAGTEIRLRDLDGGEVQDVEKTLMTRFAGDAGQHTADLTGLSVLTEIGWMPLKAVRYETTVSTLNVPVHIRVPNAAKAVVDDVLANTSSYVDHLGRLLPSGRPATAPERTASKRRRPRKG